MNELIVHQVDITHYRLVELSKLADQAKPFYDWIERIAKKTTGSHKGLGEILMSANKRDIALIIKACYAEAEEKRPLLFDGIGRVYPHTKACFYFFLKRVYLLPPKKGILYLILLPVPVLQVWLR